MSTAAQSAIHESLIANDSSNHGHFSREGDKLEAGGTQNVAMMLLCVEAVLALAYLLYVKLLRSKQAQKRATTAPVANVVDKNSASSAGILIDRMADRLALDRPTNDTASLTAVGFGSTLKRETSAGRNRRRGTSGSGHGLIRDVYT